MLHEKCIKYQVKNFYKNHFEEFKSMSMDLEDLDQEITTKVWQTIEMIGAGKAIAPRDIIEYIGKTVSNRLRYYLHKAMTNIRGVTLEDFGINGLNQTDEEILASLHEQFKNDVPDKADLYYNIVYKKLFVGLADKQIAKDLIAAKLVHHIDNYKVSNIFWHVIVPNYRQQGISMKNYNLNKILEGPPNYNKRRKDYDNDDVEDQVSQEEDNAQEYGMLMPVDGEESLLFEDIKQILTQRQYEIIEKVFKDHKTLQEIASELSISKSTVSTHYQRAIEKLRKIIKKDVI